MNEKDEVRLRDILDEAYRMQRFVTGRVRADLERDEMLAYAVVRVIEIIGEAAARVTEETRTQHANLPWRNMIGIRNRIVHDYHGVNLDIVWEVATRNIPELVPELEKILPPLSPD